MSSVIPMPSSGGLTIDGSGVIFAVVQSGFGNRNEGLWCTAKLYDVRDAGAPFATFLIKMKEVKRVIEGVGLLESVAADLTVRSSEFGGNDSVEISEGGTRMLIKGGAGVVVVVDAYSGDVLDVLVEHRGSAGGNGSAGRNGKADNERAIACWAGGDEEYVLVGGEGGLDRDEGNDIYVYKVKEGLVGKWKEGAHAGGVRGIAVCRDYDLAATTDQNTVLWRR